MSLDTSDVLILVGLTILVLAIFGNSVKSSLLEVRLKNRLVQAGAIAFGIIVFVLGLFLSPTVGSALWQRQSLPAQLATEVSSPTPVPRLMAPGPNPIPPTPTPTDQPTSTLQPALPADTPTPVSPPQPYAWISEQIRIEGERDIAWQPCPGEPADRCAHWDFNDGSAPIAVHVLKCQQDGYRVDQNGVAQLGLPVGYHARVEGITVRRFCPPSATTLELKKCGETAFAPGTFASSAPLFQRSDGYGSGWITSDPSQVVLPSGQLVDLSIRYVLMVDELAAVQLQNVSIGHIYGCWLRADLSDQLQQDAENELRRMKQEAPGTVAGLFRLDQAGLTEIDRQ